MTKQIQPTMKRLLSRPVKTNKLYHFKGGDIVYGAHDTLENVGNIYGNCTKISGDASKLIGDVSGLVGYVSGIVGIASGVFGNIDYCDVTFKQRSKGINISLLVAK
jgi:hypothetical protein